MKTATLIPNEQRDVRNKRKRERSLGERESFLLWAVRFRLNALFDSVVRLVVLSILVINIWHSDVKNVIRSRPRGP